MPPKDRHGKTAQDYRAALVAELDAVPDYHRRRKAQRSPLLFVWLLVPVALIWLNWPWVHPWLYPEQVADIYKHGSKMALPYTNSWNFNSKVKASWKKSFCIAMLQYLSHTNLISPLKLYLQQSKNTRQLELQDNISLATDSHISQKFANNCAMKNAAN